VIAGLMLLLTLTRVGSDSAPLMVTVTSAKGEARVPVTLDATGAPVLAATALLSALDGTARINEGWAEVNVARQAFRFLVGAPLYIFANRLQPLAAAASVSHDTLYLPFQFVTEVLPSSLSQRYRYDSRQARLIDVSAPRRTANPRVSVPPKDTRLPNGLRPGHIVTIDPGHGGVDPGNPGIFFPRGTREKDVTLRVGLLLRDELKRRGIGVTMTRTSDT